MLTNFKFESKRLKTVVLKRNDASVLFEMYSDHEAMKFRASKSMHSIDDAYDMIEKRNVIEKTIFKLRLGIKIKNDDTLIGTLLLKYDSMSKNECEIGFSFDKKYWNQGYGSETLQAIEFELANKTSINQLKAWCMKKNVGSIMMLKKNNFILMNQNEYPKSYLFTKNIG